MKLLVLAPHAVDATAVRAALPGEDLEGAEVLVVSPAMHQSGLRSEGANVRTETGESDPVLAVRDALVTFPADRILVFGDEELAQQVRREVDVEVTAAS